MSDVLAPSATTLLVRDAPGLEVLMVERHHQIDFASGALVFPGGKTAPADSDPHWEHHCDGGWEGAERATRIAAVREAFEESGVLLARPAGARGADRPLASADQVAPLAELRDAISKDATLLLPAIENARLVLALDALVPFAHWITPKGVPKRFDTHFFIAHAPEGQLAAHDGWETVDAVWITPNEALAAAREGRRKMVFPTRLNVEMLAHSRTAEEAMHAARSRKIVTVEPVITRGPEGNFLNIPAEAGYSVSRAPLESA